MVINSEERPACPNCLSNALVVRLANQEHCNGCGGDFGVEKVPVGAIQREARYGWPKSRITP